MEDIFEEEKPTQKKSSGFKKFVLYTLTGAVLVGGGVAVQKSYDPYGKFMGWFGSTRQAIEERIQTDPYEGTSQLVDVIRSYRSDITSGKYDIAVVTDTIVAEMPPEERAKYFGQKFAEMPSEEFDQSLEYFGQHAPENRVLMAEQQSYGKLNEELQYNLTEKRVSDLPKEKRFLLFKVLGKDVLDNVKDMLKKGTDYFQKQLESGKEKPEHVK